MIDRRTFVGGGIALGTASPLFARKTDADRIAALVPAAFSGIVLRARLGRTVFVRSYGYADLTTRHPVRETTRFAFGSGSKWLTSVAVLKLVEAGTLDLDRPLIAYLPDLRADAAGLVTLRHLLSNTSGIPDLMSRALGKEPELRRSTATAATMVARFAGGDLAFPPGSSFDYAALNWAIVVAVIERVTGKPFATVMHDIVYAPLRLRTVVNANAGFAAVPDMAHAYRLGEPPVEKMTPVPAFVAASGNAVGTAQDAMRAAHGIFATAFLSAASRRTLTTVRWPAEEYALGGRIHALGGGHWAWEAGKVEGYRALVAQNLAQDETIVVFNNTDLPQATLATLVEGIATGRA